MVRDGEPEQYGIKVIEKNNGAQALAFNLTTEPERIYTLADKLSQNSVTPATPLDIVDDWL